MPSSSIQLENQWCLCVPPKTCPVWSGRKSEHQSQGLLIATFCFQLQWRQGFRHLPKPQNTAGHAWTLTLQVSETYDLSVFHFPWANLYVCQSPWEKYCYFRDANFYHNINAAEESGIELQLQPIRASWCFGNTMQRKLNSHHISGRKKWRISDKREGNYLTISKTRMWP